MLELWMASLNYQDMASLPDFADRSDDSEDYKARFVMPDGVVLRRAVCTESWHKKYTLVGKDRSGEHTSGCTCCSSEWGDEVKSGKYDGWAWIWIWEVQNECR